MTDVDSFLPSPILRLRIQFRRPDHADSVPPTHATLPLRHCRKPTLVSRTRNVRALHTMSSSTDMHYLALIVP